MECSYRKAVGAVAAAVAVVAVGARPPAARAGAGFRTRQSSMLTAVASGVFITPIVTVGDRVGKYTFESIPDGIAVRKLPNGNAQVFVTHETSRVPFPYVPASPTVTNSFNDYDNAQLSELEINPRALTVEQGTIAIPSSANYQRFCSTFIADERHGFSRPILFAPEEATDVVNRTGNAFPAEQNGGEQAGVVVAYDINAKTYKSIYTMGRFNHENQVALPGFATPTMVSGDDTFSAPASQLYMYTSKSTDALMNDDGQLWAFVSADPAVNDYGDLKMSSSASGRFIAVPRTVAVGGQTGLENWSNQNNVFQFIRVEDIVPSSDEAGVFYFADTGEPRAIADPATGRLRRGPTGTGPYPNGRVFRMQIDPRDPTVVLRLSIVVDGDSFGAASAKVPALIHNPDNIEVTPTGLLIGEDPGSQNSYAADELAATNARIWHYDFRTGSLSIIARVDQFADRSARYGSWESSGIVDASEVFGPGAYLVNIQAHSLFVDTKPGDDVNKDGQPDWLDKKEGGQLLLMRLTSYSLR